VFKKRVSQFLNESKLIKIEKGKEVERRGAGVASLFIYMGIRPSPPFLSFDLFSESFRARKKQAPLSFNTKYQVRRETGRENFTFTSYIFFHFLILYIQTYTVLEVIEEKVKILSRKDDIYKDSRKCYVAVNTRCKYTDGIIKTKLREHFYLNSCRRNDPFSS
jgi:hypothetical protein